MRGPRGVWKGPYLDPKGALGGPQQVPQVASSGPTVIRDEGKPDLAIFFNEYFNLFFIIYIGKGLRNRRIWIIQNF